MKKCFLMLATVVSSTAFSQVIIGDEQGSTTNKTSILLDFTPNQNKGIILPYNTTLPSGSGLAEGTIILDATDNTNAKVKYYNGTWQDLSSGNGADISTVLANQPTITDKNSKGVIIGAESSTVDGVLILESQDKAMVLPQVTSTDDIISPAPGMLVYINKANAKRLAVFNGSKWTFWAPTN